MSQGAITEVRSWRTKDKFMELDQAGTENNRKLISLHVNESDVYSAYGCLQIIAKLQRLY